MKNTIGILIFSLVFIFFSSVSGMATTFTVTKAANSNDGACDGDCSLREAVDVAQSGDTVVFNNNLVGQTFTLGGSEIVITNRITIDGFLNDPNIVLISGSNASRIFRVAPAGGLDLRNMILVQGNGVGGGQNGVGGAIYAQAGSVLSLDRVSARGNTAGDIAGALYSTNAVVNIVNSSITGNLSTECAALLFNQSTVNVANATISNNRDNLLADGETRGAVCLLDSAVTIRNATIIRNIGVRSALLLQDADAEPAPLNIGNTIVAENEFQFGGDVDDFFSDDQITSVGGNLIGTTFQVPGTVFNQPNDTLGQNPLLAPTNSQQGGHPIETHPLQAGSPALNTGINANAVNPVGNMPLTTDARGTDFPRIAGGTVDKGAFEDQSNGSTLVVSKLANSNDNACDTDCSLREAVFAASQDPGTDNITMAANVFGTMIVGTEISIENQDVNIIGYPSISSNTLIVSGNDASRVFRLGNANVTMTGFTIADGNGAGSSEPFGGGGMLVGGGSLVLNQMIIRNNATAAVDLGSGGGLSVVGGSVVRIMNSTINNNSSYRSLGASIDASITYITNTTIANNLYRSPGEAGLGALTISGTLHMRNSTVANNRSVNSTTGAGLYCGASSTCNLGNNIFADNLATSGLDLFVQPGGTLQSVGGNLVENLTGFDNAEFDQPNDALGVDPVLMALADNGGNVTTLALGAGSPAINSGLNANASDPFNATPLSSDARGVGFMRIRGSSVDKGAFESLAPTAAHVTVGGRVLTPEGQGVSGVVVTITDIHSTPRMARTNNFGYFRFENVEAGTNYIFEIKTKGYSFSPQVVFIANEVTDLSFTLEY